MTNQDIIRKVQDYFDSPEITIDCTRQFDRNNPCSAVAIRMINAYQRYLSWQTNENQIELAFHRNYSVSMIGSSLFLLLVIVATFTFLYVEDNKHTKALQALQADENADKS